MTLADDLRDWLLGEVDAETKDMTDLGRTLTRCLALVEAVENLPRLDLRVVIGDITIGMPSDQYVADISKLKELIK